MRVLLGFLIFAGLALGQIAQRVRFVTTDPTGACGPSYITQNTTTGVLTGCYGGTWGALGSGGGGGSGTVTSVGLVGTANQLTVTGTSPITTSGSWTLSFPAGGVTLPGTTTIGTTVVLDGTTNGLTTASKIGGVTLSGLTGTAKWTAGVPGVDTSFCVQTKYTFTVSGGNLVLSGGASSSTALAAATTQNITIFTAASTAVRVCSVEISGTTSFAGTSITAATVNVGSGATSAFYSPNQDIFGTVGSTTNNYWSSAWNGLDRTDTAVKAYFTSTGANLSALTAGVVDIVIGIYTRP